MKAAMVLIGLGLVLGTLSDRRPARAPVYAGGYRVLAADLHVHTFPLSGSTLAPWDLPLEAERQGLDVVALSGQNEVWSGAVGRWWSRRFGGPILLESEEIHGPRFHMIAAGIHRTISWRLTASQAIDEIHRQGGVAIAAHPTASSWPAYAENGAAAKLDGTEVFQPVAFASESHARELREFFQRSSAAPIGSSDHHGMGPLGVCRTFLFVKEASEQGVLEAIRARRTGVFDGERAYGQPVDVVDLGWGGRGALPALASRIAGVLGMMLLAVAYHKK